MNHSQADAKPWLSVVIPSYNGEKWIGSALHSIAAEAADGVEVLVIDGSSTRATLDIAATYSNRLRLRTFERQDLRTWHAKSNFGVQAAHAAHICWLGVDDVWLPGRVCAVRGWINEAPDALLHLAPCAIIDRDGRTVGLWRCPFPREGEVSSDFAIERLLVQNFIAAPAPVFRRDGWLECGGLDANLWYTADWDIWLKLIACGPVYFHDCITVGFRIHGGALTVTGSRNIDDFTEQMQIVLDRHLSRCRVASASVERAARASIVVNTALALASAGRPRGLWKAASAVLHLGPSGILRYFRDSRIVDRVVPRIRARLRGVL